ncbi:MAG TPA: dihydrofolate reductase family protein [Solirubrobacteraceae bacterium]|jgi:riboflavin-specific deaminase-like protein|nr:dihydrofolate reductase family protein [Solirubrobacteraceae bacterium]
MAAKPSTTAPTRAEHPLSLERLLPADGAASVGEIVEHFGLWERSPATAELPLVMLNMVATVDGRATLGGRSGPISDAADRALFHGLRAAADAVLVGAGTVRMERYGRLIANAECRELRRRRGLSAEPLACIVSGRLALDEEIPLLAEPEARVVILTSSPASLPASGAQVDYVRTANDGILDLRAGLIELRERFAVERVLCEGGPHLCAQLLAVGLVDELFMSVAPKLAGGEPSGGEALRIVAGTELDPVVELELLAVLRAGSSLFLRYGVSARERVSRETIASSSLAR